MRWIIYNILKKNRFLLIKESLDIFFLILENNLILKIFHLKENYISLLILVTLLHECLMKFSFEQMIQIKSKF